MHIVKRNKSTPSLSLQELIGGNFTIQLAYRKEEPGRTVEVQFHQEKGYSAELV